MASSDGILETKSIESDAAEAKEQALGAEQPSTEEGAAPEHLPPYNGRLVALRTLAEVQSSLKLEEAHIVRVPAKKANNVLK